jgi:hypothetical protein
MARHLVLLGSPRELHIPYFAMAVPRSRESYVERLKLKTIGSERRALAIKLQERLRRGDFDLGRVGDEQQRENLARRYVETADTLRVLSSQLSLVDMARQLAERWQNEL